jgi:rod shape-determining protein MreC
MQMRRREKTSPFERQFLSTTAPLQAGIGSLTSIFGGGGDDYQRLDAENRQLRSRLVELEEFRLENVRLKGLLDFRSGLGSEAVVARVIGVDATSWFQTIAIDKGTEQGLREGMAVINQHGVVGRIVKCAARSSRVLLLIDASSAVATLVERTRTRSVCRGNGNSLVLDYVALPEDVEPGDMVVTSGLGGVFPKGLPVGTVKSVVRGGFSMFQTIEVESSVDFSRIEEVLVLYNVPLPYSEPAPQ